MSDQDIEYKCGKKYHCARKMSETEGMCSKTMKCDVMSRKKDNKHYLKYDI